jgi:hypothetical protein
LWGHSPFHARIIKLVGRGERVVLRAAVEEEVAAGGAVVEAVIVGVYEKACERLESPTALPGTRNENECGHGCASSISSTTK